MPSATDSGLAWHIVPGPGPVADRAGRLLARLTQAVLEGEMVNSADRRYIACSITMPGESPRYPILHAPAAALARSARRRHLRIPAS